MQVSVLGPVVNIFISDPEEVAELTAMRFAANSRILGAINMLQRRAAILGNLGRLKERADRSLLSSTRTNENPFYLGRNNSCNSNGWGAALRALALGVCRRELTRSQQCPGSKDRQRHPGLYEQESHNHSPSLVSTSSNTQETLINNQCQNITTSTVRPGTLAS